MDASYLSEMHILKERECAPGFLERESIVIKGLPLIHPNKLFIFTLKINCLNKFRTDTYLELIYATSA